MNTILLTGGKGFIGSHVLIALTRRYPKHKIVVADAQTYASRPPLYIHRPPNVVDEKVDIRDHLAVHRLYSKHKPTVTVHMAAESHVCRSITGPKDFATTNIMGTFNLLEEHRASGCGRFLHISTDEVFGEIRKGKFNEESPMRPRSPYAASKAGSDLLVRSYHETYDTDTVTVNMSNNFGPNQHPEKLVPRTIINILQGKEVIVHGKGNHIRDWLYVEDAAHGILQALEVGVEGESYCLGGEWELTNLEMIKTIHRLIQSDEPHIKLKLKHTNDRPTDDFRYALEIEKAREHLGFAPRFAIFDDLLKTTIDWYRHAILHSEGGALHGRGV